MTYILGACHHRTNMMYHLDGKGVEAKTFYIMNLALLIIPQVFAVWCHRDAEKFGRSQTVYRYEVEQNGPSYQDRLENKKRL